MSIFVFIDGKQLFNYTSVTLQRSKSDLTGQAQIDIFMNWIPTEPVLDDVTKGKELTIYIGEHLVFLGDIDRRQDAGVVEQPNDNQSRLVSAPREGPSSNASISASSYSVTLSCRGKTSKLIDNSQQHETGTMLGTTNRDAVMELVKPWGIEVDWKAEVIDVPRVRFRDGARVVDEIERLAEQFALYAFETRDGKLKVIDKAGDQTGEPIVLGRNILSFNTSQAADQERSEVLAKGQLVGPDKWGEAAVLPTQERLKDGSLSSFSPITVQLYGDGNSKQLNRRANYELNKRAAEARQITVDVYHIQQPNGEPWDIGDLHYVEIPPAGVFGQFELTEVKYVVEAKDTIKTTITLSPLPSAPPSPGQSGGALSSLPDPASIGNIDIAARIAQFGVSGLTSSWSSPDILKLAIQKIAGSVGTRLLDIVESNSKKPPLKLPPGFKGSDR